MKNSLCVIHTFEQELNSFGSLLHSYALHSGYILQDFARGWMTKQRGTERPILTLWHSCCRREERDMSLLVSSSLLLLMSISHSEVWLQNRFSPNIHSLQHSLIERRQWIIHALSLPFRSSPSLFGKKWFSNAILLSFFPLLSHFVTLHLQPVIWIQ